MKAGSSHPAEYLTQLQLNKKRQEKDMHVVETSLILALLLVRPPPVSGPRICAWLGATHLHNFFWLYYGPDETIWQSLHWFIYALAQG